MSHKPKPLVWDDAWTFFDNLFLPGKLLGVSGCQSSPWTAMSGSMLRALGELPTPRKHWFSVSSTHGRVATARSDS